jgi:ACT domain-containing protein
LAKSHELTTRAAHQKQAEIIDLVKNLNHDVTGKVAQVDGQLSRVTTSVVTHDQKVSLFETLADALVNDVESQAQLIAELTRRIARLEKLAQAAASDGLPQKLLQRD